MSPALPFQRDEDERIGADKAACSIVEHRGGVADTPALSYCAGARSFCVVHPASRQAAMCWPTRPTPSNP